MRHIRKICMFFCLLNVKKFIYGIDSLFPFRYPDLAVKYVCGMFYLEIWPSGQLAGWI